MEVMGMHAMSIATSRTWRVIENSSSITFGHPAKMICLYLHFRLKQNLLFMGALSHFEPIDNPQRLYTH